MVKLPNWLGGRNAAARNPNRSQQASKRAVERGQKASAVDPTHIDEEEDLVDTGSDAGSNAKRQLGGGQSFSAATQNPLGDRAHLVNRGALEAKAKGAASLDPSSLEPVGKSHKDAARFLAKLGVEWQVGEGWQSMATREGKGVLFFTPGQNHAVEITPYAIRDADVPLEKLALSLTDEDVEERKRLGTLSDHRLLKLGDVNGVLLVGAGPNSKAELDALVAEKGQDGAAEHLYFATDSTMLRSMSWRGAVKWHGDSHMLFVSFTSPIETFFDARAIYDEMLARGRIVG